LIPSPIRSIPLILPASWVTLYTVVEICDAFIPMLFLNICRRMFVAFIAGIDG
jgi:hypothetical protein